MTSKELARIKSLTDPRERAQAANELAGDAPEALRVRDDAVVRLVTTEGATRKEMADLLDMSTERVRQILSKGAAPERSLFVPDGGERLTVAIVEKKDADRGTPVTAIPTRNAVSKLTAVAADLNIKIDEESIPQPGIIDLNRDNLLVMIGPRISALIAQAISADPVIRWERDGRGHWYIIDTMTNEEYHSDFDDSLPSSQHQGTCIGHIGRIRRPDGRGSFLYLAGAHVPGTAGAVAYFLENTSAIWEEVRRSPQWSAVVVTLAGDDNKPITWERRTPIYTHGRN